MRLVSAQVLRCHDMSRIGRRLPVVIQYSNFIGRTGGRYHTNSVCPPASVMILFISMSVVSRKYPLM